MGDAYAYMDSASPTPLPAELALLVYIDRFGVEAVMGRPVLYANELRRMIAAEQVMKAYNARRSAANIVEWAQSFPEQAERLALAAMYASESNYLQGMEDADVSSE